MLRVRFFFLFIKNVVLYLDLKMPGVEELSSLVARLEIVAARLEGASGSIPVSQEAAAQFVSAFDDILAAEFKTFIEKSKKIGRI